MEPREIIKQIEPVSLLKAGDNTGLLPRYHIPHVVPDQSLQIRDYLAILWRHARLVLGFTLLCTTVVMLLLSLSPNFYEATAKLQISPDKADAVMEESVPYGALVSSDPTYIGTQLQIISSPLVARQVVKALDLEHDESFRRNMAQGGRMMRRLLRLFYLGKKHNETPRGTVPLTSALTPSQTEADFEEARRLEPFVKDLQSKLSTAPVKEPRTVFRETRLVEVAFKHPNPDLAARVANAVADAYIQYTYQEHNAGARMKNENVAQRLVELQKEIRAAEARLMGFADAHDIISLRPGENIAVDRLSTLNRHLVEAENDRKMAEASYGAALDGTSIPSMAEDQARAEISEAETRLAVLRQRKAQLLVTATEKWPEVREVLAETAAVEVHLQGIRARASKNAQEQLKTKYKQSLAREQAVRTAFEQQRKLNFEQNQAAVDYRLLQQGIDTRKRILDAMLERLGKTAAAQATPASTAQVVEYAFVPDPSEPAGPIRLPYVLVTLVLSFLGASVFAFVLDNVDDTFRSGQEIRSLLSVPALAQVQAVRRSPFGKLRILLSRGKGGGPGPELLHSSDVPLPMVEEYRRLRAAVLFPSQLPSPKKILVTSTLPGEGKTTTTANVALSLAQCDRRVLLVDADLRKPRLHQIFGLSNSRGLSDLLLAEGTPDATEYIAKRVADNLDLLVAGSKSSNPAELLGSERMKATTEALLGSYDYVIFDSPSAVSAVDGLILARAVDGVLFVVRAGKVSRALVNETLNDLRGTGTRLLGVVLNNAEPGAFNRYYG